MTVEALCCFGIVAAVTAFLLREFGWRGLPVYVLLTLTFLLSSVLPSLSTGVGFLVRVGSGSGLSEVASALVRVLGVGYLSSITGDVCVELGAPTAARAVSLGAKFEILAIAYPYLEKIVAVGTGLVGV